MKIFAFLCIFFSSYAFSYTDAEFAYIETEFGVTRTEIESLTPMNLDAQSNSQKEMEQAMTDLYYLSKKADKGARGWVRLVSFLLIRKGHGDLANQIQTEYDQYYFQTFYNDYRGIYQDLGDHPPFSEWWAIMYDAIELILTKETCQLLHIDDFDQINYAVPVVFHPAGEIRNGPIEPWTQLDYSQHFIPFSGGVSYWVTYIACTGATFGMGVAIACSPIGSICERAITNFVAPKMSDRIWKRYNE